MTASDIQARLVEGGSRELDCRIEKLVGLAVALDGAGRATAGDGTRYRVPNYSTSADAALALAARVLPGLGAWDVGYAYNAEPPYYARLVLVREGPPEEFGRANTPAAALCIAILKAKALQDGRDG